MVSIQERFLIKSGLLWRAYGKQKLTWRETEEIKIKVFFAEIHNMSYTSYISITVYVEFVTHVCIFLYFTTQELQGHGNSK